MRSGIALLAVLALVGPGSAQTKSEEITEIGGRSLSQWIKDITHKDPSKREVAIRTVLGFGPEKAYEAVPAMLTELRRHSANYPIDTSVRVNIAISVGAILGAKKDPDPKIVKDAVTLLIRLLSDSQGIVKYRAAGALASIGPESRTATTALMPLLLDKGSWEVRHAGAMTLGKVATDPKTGPPPFVITGLQNLLIDQAYQVRHAACQGLASLGPPGDPAQKAAVLKALEPVAKKDAEPVVQIWAHMAIIGYTGKTGDDNLGPIATYLHKGDVATRIQAAQALGAVGSGAKETVPTLIGALDDPDPNVIGWAIWALGRMESARAIAPLEKFAANTKQPDPLKKAAKLALEQLTKKMSK